MARKKSAHVSLDQHVQSVVNQTLLAAFERLGGIEGIAGEIRELKTAVTKLGRRLPTGKTAKGRGRASGKGHKRPGRPSIHERCKIADCGEPHYALALCSKHYQQYRRGQLKLAKTKAGKEVRRGRPSKKGGRK